MLNIKNEINKYNKQNQKKTTKYSLNENQTKSLNVEPNFKAEIFDISRLRSLLTTGTQFSSHLKSMRFDYLSSE